MNIKAASSVKKHVPLTLQIKSIINEVPNICTRTPRGIREMHNEIIKKYPVTYRLFSEVMNTLAVTGYSFNGMTIHTKSNLFWLQ